MYLCQQLGLVPMIVALLVRIWEYPGTRRAVDFSLHRNCACPPTHGNRLGVLMSCIVQTWLLLSSARFG